MNMLTLGGDGDPYHFTLKIKNHPKIYVDGMELAAAVALNGPQEDGSERDYYRAVGEQMLTCAWGPDGVDLSIFTKPELAGAGIKVLERLQHLGNSPARQPDAPRCTDSSPLSAV